MITFGAVSAYMADLEITIPEISVLTVVYFFVFFILGYFIYATIYALDRFDGDVDAGRRAVCVSADYAFAGWFVFLFCGCP